MDPESVVGEATDVVGVRFIRRTAAIDHSVRTEMNTRSAPMIIIINNRIDNKMHQTFTNAH